MRKDLPITTALFPMPVILIATYNEDGSVDVMNAAWGCAYTYTQVFLNLDSAHKTFKNILRNKAFTIALADAEHVAQADYVGMVSANNVKDKFEKSGLHASQGLKVNAPVIEDFGLIMECEAVQVSAEDGVIGEIKRLAVDDKYIDENGRVDVAKLNIIAFDPLNRGYYVVNEKVGQAFSEGRRIK